MNYEIVFYADARGDKPPFNFLSQLDEIGLGQVDKSFGMVQKYGPTIGYPYTDYIGNKIGEIRAGSSRFLFTMWNGNILILSAFRKKSNKTPKTEIETAERRLKDWISRKGQ